MQENNPDRSLKDMHRERDYTEYENTLLGLEATIQYLLTLNHTPILVDSGTGSGKAARQLKEKHLQLQVKGVDKQRHPNVSANLGNNFIQRDMSHVPELVSSSVHGVLAVHSIAYANPHEFSQIAAEIARITTPGALIKGSALHPLVKASTGLKITSVQIADSLSRVGFVSTTASDVGIEDKPGEDVFIGIKLAENDDPNVLEDLLIQILNADRSSL